MIVITTVQVLHLCQKILITSNDPFVQKTPEIQFEWCVLLLLSHSAEPLLCDLKNPKLSSVSRSANDNIQKPTDSLSGRIHSITTICDHKTTQFIHAIKEPGSNKCRFLGCGDVASVVTYHFNDPVALVS